MLLYEHFSNTSNVPKLIYFSNEFCSQWNCMDSELCTLAKNCQLYLLHNGFWSASFIFFCIAKWPWVGQQNKLCKCHCDRFEIISFCIRLSWIRIAFDEIVCGRFGFIVFNRSILIYWMWLNMTGLIDNSFQMPIIKTCWDNCLVIILTRPLFEFVHV